MHVSKLWRGAAIAVAGGGLVAGLAATPATASTATGSIITVNATSPNYPGLRAKDHGKVDGYALVVYKAKNGVNTATVSGDVTTTATNDTATLLAKPFGAKTFAAVGTPVSLTPVSGVAPYSFNVKPTVATSYQVQLAGTDTVASSVVSVYVSAGGRTSKAHQHCSHTKCTFSFRIYTYVPTSKAYKTESPKHWYEYLAVGYPRLPKDYTLSKTATASKATKVNAGEYQQTLTFYIPLRNGSAFWIPSACVKDTESKDGLGLPGHHGCGAKRFSRNTLYLG